MDGTITVADGSTLRSLIASLGEEPGASGTVTVTGNDSRWNNDISLNVGRDGNGTLIAESGGVIRSGYGQIAHAPGATGMALISGAGSEWNIDYVLDVGDGGSGTLHVEAGGRVASSSSNLGYDAGSSGTAMVTGEGSEWNTSTQLYVGRFGSGSLTVESGGKVTAGTLYASLDDLHGDGTITATQGAVVDADLEFDAAHGTQAVTSFGSGGTLSVTVDAGNLGVGYKGQGSLTVSDGIVLSGRYGYLGDRPGSVGEATITGGSQWNSSEDLSIGIQGMGTLRVEAGGQVGNWEGSIGVHSGSTGSATITGADSLWTNGGDLSVGREGSGLLRVEAGGQVSNSKVGYIGYALGSAGEVTVTGPGSQWNNGSHLYVGFEGSGTLTVEDGGQVTASTLFASLDDLHGDGSITAIKGVVLDAEMRFDAGSGVSQTSTFGSGGILNVTVDGGDLGAGYKGQGSLTVADGIAISSGRGYLGYDSGSVGSAIVTGPGSLWENAAELYVGREGRGTLTVEDGGHVTAGTLYGSLNDLHGDGTIAVTKGAVLDADMRFDGSHEANQSLSFGSGGVLSVTVDGSDLGVGYYDQGSLTVADGMAISSYYGYLGYHSGSSGSAIVTGAGSMWTTRQDLYVGREGSGTLRIEAGAEVDSGNAAIGFFDDSIGSVTVTGADAHWDIGLMLVVGSFGHGGLTIADGGLVSTPHLSIDAMLDPEGSDDSFVNMSTGGRLALFVPGGSSIDRFLQYVQGTGTIRYWSTEQGDWAPITEATYGDDYTLEYFTTGDMAGYTVLTVGTVPIPEPPSLAMLLFACLACVWASRTRCFE
ncbi:hypothetical protein [Aeoliella sp.]|uniref:hypothetical protein n=1 Tax=Aeoliella sp. TaxID=2795800 RepID=UPI003CCC19FC